MKLKIEEFEAFVKRNGKSASAMCKKLGGDDLTFRRLKKGNKLGYDLARGMYNILGEWTFLMLVDMEKETIDGFKAKYITIGNKLY